MMPLLPFVAGLFVGAAAVSALRSERARNLVNNAGSSLRAAVQKAKDSTGAPSAEEKPLTEEPLRAPPEPGSTEVAV